jgi:hypothetical protein
VGSALVDLEQRVLHDLRGEPRRIVDGHDLVVAAVDDERWHVDLLEVLGEVGLREGLDAEVGRREAGHHALEPERLADALGDLRARAVVAVERQAQFLPELRPIGEHGGPELVEGLDRRAAGVGRRLEHEWRDRADEHGLGHAGGAVPADVARDLAAAGGMADVDRVLEVERLHHRREVVRVRVHVIAVPGLAGAAVAATVVGDATVAVRGQEEHLVLKRVRGQRPAVAEDDRLPLAPVLVIDLRAVLRLDDAHRAFLRPRPLRAGRQTTR